MSALEAHAVITPARNERDNLGRLSESLLAQTWRPTAWLVVDNGSTDDTADVVRAMAADHDWIRLLAIEGTGPTARGTASVRAFNAGVAALGFEPDLITNADADVSYEPGYFEGLRKVFEAIDELGIASGLCYEFHDDSWRPVRGTSPSIRGASFTYRAACLAQLAPVEARVGWDGIEIVRATLRGWETATIPTLSYFHHRATGARDRSRFFGWSQEGAVSYYMWYRPFYLVTRALYRVIATRDLAATGLIWGYASSALRREARHADPGFRRVVHDRQSLRNLAATFREVRSFGVSGGTQRSDGSP